MKTIVMTAYAVNPYKGSEDGMGWNFVLQGATRNNIIAVTRKNNRPAIEKYMAENPDARYANIQFNYFDWPKWMLFWKKGPILSLIYYYFWQLTLALHIRTQNWQFDLVHNLNFHNDWTPSFLWLTGKPMVWGPVGHHPKVPNKYLRFYGKKAIIGDGFLWTLKNIFWKLDPFLWITKTKAKHIFCMNQDAADTLNLPNSKYSICPSVATEDSPYAKMIEENFTIISAGRFVPLKGFDICIKAFAHFYKSLNSADQKKARLHLVGSGPYEAKLKTLAQELNIENAIIWTKWIQRDELQKLYAASSAFLFPSYEGAGMVVAEALSHHLPVLCWDNSGPGQFVSTKSKLKVSLDLSEKEAINQFSQNLNNLYFNKAFYETESKLSRQRFEENFKWEKREAQLNDVYQSLNHNSALHFKPSFS